MICDKCGHNVPEGSGFCPSCGQKISAKGKGIKILKTVIIAVISLFLAAVIFMFGLYFGKTEVGRQINTPDIIATIAEKIKSISAFPVDIELTQEDINIIIQKYSAQMDPLENVYLTLPQDGGLTVTGTVAKENVKTLLGDSIPDLIILFLPEDVPLSVHADPTFINGEIQPRIDSFTVAGLTLDKDALSIIGADAMITDLLTSAISQYGERIEIQEISVTSSAEGERVLKISAVYYPSK